MKPTQETIEKHAAQYGFAHMAEGDVIRNKSVETLRAIAISFEIWCVQNDIQLIMNMGNRLDGRPFSAKVVQRPEYAFKRAREAYLRNRRPPPE